MINEGQRKVGDPFRQGDRPVKLLLLLGGRITLISLKVSSTSIQTW